MSIADQKGAALAIGGRLRPSAAQRPLPFPPSSLILRTLCIVVLLDGMLALLVVVLLLVLGLHLTRGNQRRALVESILGELLVESLDVESSLTIIDG